VEADFELAVELSSRLTRTDPTSSVVPYGVMLLVLATMVAGWAALCRAVRARLSKWAYASVPSGASGGRIGGGRGGERSGREDDGATRRPSAGHGSGGHAGGQLARMGDGNLDGGGGCGGMYDDGSPTSSPTPLASLATTLAQLDRATLDRAMVSQQKMRHEMRHACAMEKEGWDEDLRDLDGGEGGRVVGGRVAGGRGAGGRVSNGRGGGQQRQQHWRVEEVVVVRSWRGQALGLELNQNSQQAWVVSVLALGSPAELSGGLCVGDTVATINGRSLPASQSGGQRMIASVLADANATSVTLGVLRPASRAAAVLHGGRAR
jgi:hypothetical protein